MNNEELNILINRFIEGETNENCNTNDDPTQKELTEGDNQSKNK